MPSVNHAEATPRPKNKKMNKTLTTLALLLLAIVAQAQTPQQMLDRAIAALKSAGTVSANYKVKSPQGSSTGTIVMAGNKYRLVSKEMKCWYDGKTQWAWSPATDEVNITTPTAADLQMTNPMAAAADFKTNFNMWKSKGQIPGNYAIMLMPKKKNDIERVYLYINTTTNLLHIAHIKMRDGTALTLTLNGYKTNLKLPASTFTYDKSMVPPGTQVVDLR